MSLILIVFGIAGFIWCLLPILSYGVLNIGNATGLVVFGIIFIYGVLRKKIKPLIGKAFKKIPGRIILSAMGTLACVILFLVVAETICMFGTAKAKPEGGETVVVLGSYVSKSGPSVMTKCRLNGAVDYMNANPDSVCVVTGGQGKDEPWPEADAMKEYMVNAGISEERIYKERESKNTRENLLYTERIILENHLNPKIAILSNEFHLYRAGRIADRLDLEHCYISAASPYTMFSSYYIRELYAILADWLIYSRAGVQK